MELYLLGSIIGIVLTALTILYECSIKELILYMKESDETWFDYCGYVGLVVMLSWVFVVFLIVILVHDHALKSAIENKNKEL